MLVLVIRYFLFAPFIVDGPSMQPNFYTGERLIVEQNRSMISASRSTEKSLCSMCPRKAEISLSVSSAFPATRSNYEDDNLYVNGKKVDEPYLKQSIANAKAEGQLFNTENRPTTNFPN